MTRTAPSITVRDVTDRAASIGYAIVTYRIDGAKFPWCAEVVGFDRAAGVSSRIGIRGVIGRGVDCAEAIKALGVDF